MKKDQKEAVRIIDELGGVSAVAAIFKVRQPSVSEWKKRGIPPARKQTLALMFPDKVPPEWLPNKAA